MAKKTRINLTIHPILKELGVIMEINFSTALEREICRLLSPEVCTKMNEDDTHVYYHIRFKRGSEEKDAIVPIKK